MRFSKDLDRSFAQTNRLGPRARTRCWPPVYSNDGLSRKYGTAANPRYPEAAYGFQAFIADVGRTSLVGFDHLNPRLQERVIKTKIDRGEWHDGKPRTYATGRPTAKGARNLSARTFDR